MTLIFTPNVSKRWQVSLVLVSSVLQTQHIEDGYPAPLTVHLQTLSLFFAPPTATDGKVDDSSLENLDVWIIEIQTSQTDPRRLLITDCGAQFISLGPRTVGVTAGSPRSISASWMWIQSDHHHCHHCSTSARSEWSFIAEIIEWSKPIVAFIWEMCSLIWPRFPPCAL